MAKTIPQKKTKKTARKKQIEENFSTKAQKKAERQISSKLMELDEAAEQRWEWVQQIMSSCGDDIDQIMKTMVESLQKMQGSPRLVIDGQVVNLSDPEFQMLLKIQDRNFHWIAMRCLVACAEWGIRIGNFKAPKKACLRCGKKVK